MAALTPDIQANKDEVVNAARALVEAAIKAARRDD